MLRLFPWIALTVVCALAAPAFAVDFPCADNTTSCDPYAEDVEVGGGETGGGTSGKWLGLVATRCETRGRDQEKCYDAPDTDNDGKPEPCVLVQYSAGCACHSTGLVTYGTCSYSW